MKCPKCGAENVDSAEFCSLCAEKLLPSQPGTAPATQRARRVPSETYIAPGEWRGDAETLRPTVSKVVESKVRRFRWRLIIYSTVIAIIVIWLVLSFTLWGNPSAGEVSRRLIDAANKRDPAAFVSLFQEQNEALAQDMYSRITTYLGSSGEYQDIDLNVEQPNNYSAYTYLVGGTITTAGGATVTVDRSQNMIISLENRGGVWYVMPFGTDLIP
jgi:uncharacterized membrane protein YvbJ